MATLLKPASRSLSVKVGTPTSAKIRTAGMLSEYISARSTVTSPAQLLSKFSGRKPLKLVGTSGSFSLGVTMPLSTARAYKKGFSVLPGERMARTPSTCPLLAASWKSAEPT